MGYDQQVASWSAMALWGCGCCYYPLCQLLWSSEIRRQHQH